MKRLLLVRHGLTETNAAGLMRGWTDDPLSPLGRRQVAVTAEYLLTQAPFEALYCSTLPRSLETAEVIAARLGLRPQARDDLRELNLGDLEGRGEDELWSYFVERAGAERGLSGMRDVKLPGGESVVQFIQRTRAALGAIAQAHAGRVVVVSHGVQTMAALGLWLEPDVRQWPAYRVSNCSISEIAFDPAPRLIRLNDTAHLASAAG